MGLPVLSASDGWCYRMGGEKVAETTTALTLEKMLTRLGTRLKRKRMVLNRRGQTRLGSIPSCSFDWNPGTDIRIEYYRWQRGCPQSERMEN